MLSRRVLHGACIVGEAVGRGAVVRHVHRIFFSPRLVAPGGGGTRRFLDVAVLAQRGGRAVGGEVDAEGVDAGAGCASPVSGGTQFHIDVTAMVFGRLKVVGFRARVVGTFVERAALGRVLVVGNTSLTAPITGVAYSGLSGLGSIGENCFDDLLDVRDRVALVDVSAVDAACGGEGRRVRDVDAERRARYGVAVDFHVKQERALARDAVPDVESLAVDHADVPEEVVFQRVGDGVVGQAVILAGRSGAQKVALVGLVVDEDRGAEVGVFGVLEVESDDASGDATVLADDELEPLAAFSAVDAVSLEVGGGGLCDDVPGLVPDWVRGRGVGGPGLDHAARHGAGTPRL
ncbi:bifunctional aldolase/short-chain dehydrogenase [Babesia caballi]|uniref:Bifunctional aldolase/short-chain dehydrogenase n=1 Tax=Babesia caballi TaxID=5871 RepID=A0AAV4LSR4_BABCB|nr:bifunctional aldolase/short-chain dehydrogenase [Babesia caballi]